MIVTTPPSKPYLPWYKQIELPVLVPGALLAAVMVWSVVQSVASANWAEGLGVLVIVALPALLVGLLFARLPWLPGWLAHLLSAVLGVAWSIQSIGGILQREVASQFGAALADRLVNWTDRASEIVIRFINLGRIVQAGGRGEDIVLFIVALSLLMWALGYATGWLLFRNGATWAAVLLNAAVILVNYTYTLPKPDRLFFVFLGAALLLIVYQHIVHQQRRWSAALIDFPDWMPARFVTAAALAIGITVLITSLLPGQVSITQAARTWRMVSAPFTAMRESWETAFSTIQAPPGSSGSGFFARSIRVGGGRSLGDGEVLRIQSSAYDYWRAITRDRYTSRGWENTVGEIARSEIGASTAESARTPLEVGFNAFDPASIGGRTLVTQTVQLVQDRADDLLVMGGQFDSAGLPVLVEHTFAQQDGLLAPNYTETSAVFSQVPLQATSTYTVASYISFADVASLQGTPQEYPAWISERYLQLPETLPERVRGLATQIVTEADATTPYDKAIAIQNYLRAFVYDESRAAPPTDRDWADYFLFDSQRGYCDDFATAMIAMLRAEGVPARLAQGYAGGTFDTQSGYYIVRENIAHSWPEVYFPGFGWQRFEPTPASYASAPIRPATSTTGDTNSTGALPIDPGSLGDSALQDLEDLQLEREAAANAAAARVAAEQQAQFQRNVGIGLAVVVALLALLAFFYYQLNRNLRGLSPAAAAYARLSRMATWAGVRQEEHLTPTEYGEALGSQLPEQREHVDTIIGGYVQERYKGSAPKADYDAEWQALRRPLLGRLFSRFFERRKP